mgnify:CR=1 FL=1
MVQQVPFSGIENPINFRNYLHNGGYQIAEIGTSFADPTDQTWGLDRWGMFNSNDGAATWSQETATPSGVGAYNSMKVTVTSADTSIGSSQYLATWQGIEGQVLRRAGLGTSGSKKLTLSFWVKCSLTGTFCVSLRNAALDRSFIKEYTISSADTWEKKQVTFDAETSGTWLATNGLSAYLTFALSMGSGFHGTADSWQTSNVTATSNQANLMATTHNWSIANCQLEDGDTASDFENLPFDVELQRCQRYRRLLKMSGIHYTYQFSTNWSRANPTYANVGNEMRTLPSASWLSATPTYDDATQTVAADENKFRWGYNGATNDTSPSSTLGIDNIGFYSLSVYNNGINHSSNGSSGFVIWAKQAAIVLSAEI